MGTELVCAKMAALRSLIVAMARSSFWEVRLADSQDFAFSRVYLIDT
jgi:hypothetical protein